MTSKILREIARPFRKLSGHKPAGPALRTPTGESAELLGAVKLPHVEYLAPTSTLGELLPASNQAEIRLMTRLIRTHVWAMPEHELMVLGAIVATLRPRKLFEFGTYTGGSTLTIAANAAVEPSGRPPTPSGPQRRRPTYSGVEARDIPGLAAHLSKPSCRPRAASQRFGRSNCSLDREKSNSASSPRNPPARKLFLSKCPACFLSSTR